MRYRDVPAGKAIIKKLASSQALGGGWRRWAWGRHLCSWKGRSKACAGRRWGEQRSEKISDRCLRRPTHSHPSSSPVSAHRRFCVYRKQLPVNAKGTWLEGKFLLPILSFNVYILHAHVNTQINLHILINHYIYYMVGSVARKPVVKQSYILKSGRCIIIFKYFLWIVITPTPTPAWTHVVLLRFHAGAAWLNRPAAEQRRAHVTGLTSEHPAASTTPKPGERLSSCY